MLITQLYSARSSETEWFESALKAELIQIKYILLHNFIFDRKKQQKHKAVEVTAFPTRPQDQNHKSTADVAVWRFADSPRLRIGSQSL